MNLINPNFMISTLSAWSSCPFQDHKIIGVVIILKIKTNSLWVQIFFLPAFRLLELWYQIMLFFIWFTMLLKIGQIRVQTWLEHAVHVDGILTMNCLFCVTLKRKYKCGEPSFCFFFFPKKYILFSLSLKIYTCTEISHIGYNYLLISCTKQMYSTLIIIHCYVERSALYYYFF